MSTLDKYRVCFKYLLIIKTCSLITIRFYFVFQKFFIVDGLAVMFLFNSIAHFISDIFIFFLIIDQILYEKINPFSFTIITFYISTYKTKKTWKNLCLLFYGRFDHSSWIFEVAKFWMIKLCFDVSDAIDSNKRT